MVELLKLKDQYKFINHEFEIDNIQLAANRIEQRAHTIFLSMLLRTGAKIEHILDVAKKVDENISSFSSVCRRVLSKYIVQEINGESCPNCGDKLIMQDGCVKCVNPECGFSKC
jgi:NADH pyrophosphatase NudC (nudix superfamily)